MEPTDANRRVYEGGDMTALQGRRYGFFDAAEQEALLRVADRVRGRKVLDLGVGGGRTIGLLRLLSADYSGIDYSEALVEVARRRYPGTDVSWGDARDLSRFGEGTFALVVFSWNGIDTVGRSDRLRVLAEVARVLQPGGLFVFSTLNLKGMSYRETPFQLHRPGQPVDASPVALLRIARRNFADPGRFPRRVGNWRRSRRIAERGDGWGTAALSTLDFRLVNHFTGLGVLRSDLRGAGLAPEVILSTGPPGGVEVVGEDASESSCDNFHVVAVSLRQADG